VVAWRNPGSWKDRRGSKGQISRCLGEGADHGMFGTDRRETRSRVTRAADLPLGRMLYNRSGLTAPVHRKGMKTVCSPLVWPVFHEPNSSAPDHLDYLFPNPSRRTTGLVARPKAVHRHTPSSSAMCGPLAADHLRNGCWVVRIVRVYMYYLTGCSKFIID